MQQGTPPPLFVVAPSDLQPPPEWKPVDAFVNEPGRASVAPFQAPAHSADPPHCTQLHPGNEFPQIRKTNSQFGLRPAVRLDVTRLNRVEQ